MRVFRPHSKIWLAWNDWLAFQFVRMPELALGVRYVWERGYLDLYLGPLTIAIGRHPVLTDPRTAQWDSCRGLLLVGSEDEIKARML